jgi:hypothetical protein
VEDIHAGDTQLAGITYEADAFRQLYCILLSFTLLAPIACLPLKKTVFSGIMLLDKLLGDSVNLLIAEPLKAARKICSAPFSQSPEDCTSARCLHLIDGLWTKL